MQDKVINKVLLINPAYTFSTYLEVDRNAGTMQHPIISLASIAGSLKSIADTKIIDFDIVESGHLSLLRKEIYSFKPDLVGITATTPVFPSLLEIARRIKQINLDILVVAGGVHVTTYPQDALDSPDIDIVVVGEADFFIRDFIQSKNRLSLKGAYFKYKGSTVFNEKSTLIEDLDALPYPDWSLYDLKKYRASRLIERRSPGGLLETSRGCPFLCTYCNKKTFSTLWRKKSVNRVISEFQYMKGAGFKEIHIEDDGFTTDINRAKEICRQLIRVKNDIPWTLINGIRVDRVDEELFGLFKQAGCYQVAFGIESGDDEILKKIKKGITVKQIEKAIRMAYKAGLETFGFFMFGLPGETEESMQKTIDLALKLPLTISKFGITIPYPGTVLFDELDAQGRILHKNWKDYLLHNTKACIYTHANLSWDTILSYYKKAYRRFYFRPWQFYVQIIGSLKNNTLWDKLSYFVSTKWF